MNYFNKLLVVGLVVISGLFFSVEAQADKGDKGVDWSVYQGQTGRFGYADDQFMIAQIGGYNSNGLYNQWTYPSQVASAIAQGKRAHTYIWYDTWRSLAIAKRTMDYFLPKIQTPKNSIVALDFESGASADKQANTETVLYGMRRIKQAGFTPMYYSYKPFTLANLYYEQILNEFPDSLWIAAYPSYEVTPNPLYQFFPSMTGIAIWQFTSTYIAGGLDGNIDLTGITDNGYTITNQPETAPPAVEEGKEITEEASRDLKVGDTVTVDFAANRWLTGETIPEWVKGNSYTIQEIKGERILLADVFSWINKNDLKQTALTSPSEPINKTMHIVQAGENLSTIAGQYGTTYQELAVLNQLGNPDFITVGQRLIITSSATTNRSYVIKTGDTLTAIAQKLATNVATLTQLNQLANPNLIYAGQTLFY